MAASLAHLAAYSEPTPRTSARNVLPGIITAIAHGAVNSEVGLLINDRTVIDVLVSNSCVADLDLRPGGRAVAMVKASLVTLIDPQAGLRFSDSNLLGGMVVNIALGEIQAEVVLDIGEGCEISAVVTSRSAFDMKLQPDVPVLASFNASQVLLAVEE